MVIKEGCLGIRRSCFSGCVRLENLQLPDSLRYLGINAVWGCVSLHVLRITRGTFPGIRTTSPGITLHLEEESCSYHYPLQANGETKSSSDEFLDGGRIMIILSGWYTKTLHLQPAKVGL